MSPYTFPEMVAPYKYAILLVCLYLALARSPLATAQTVSVPLLEKRITIHFHGESIERALERIETLGGFTFSYSPAILDDMAIVHGSLHDLSLRECLDYLFSGIVTYREIGPHIILTAQNSGAVKDTDQKQVVITGYVTNIGNGQRIAAATIVERRSLRTANTNAFGYFTLRIEKPEWPLNLEAFKANYERNSVTITTPTEAARSKNFQIRELNPKPVTTRPASPLPRPARDSVWVPLPMEMPPYNSRELVMRNVADTIYRKGQISLLPFVGSNHLLSGNVINDYSINLIGGYSFGNRKVEMGGVFNTNRADVSGLQAAGVFNIVNGKARAAQFAGVGNLNRGPSGKLKMAGVMNIHGDSLNGTAIAGVFNYSHKNTSGLSLAGIFNHQNGHCSGAQIAGVFNVAPAGITKGQLAGVFNVSAKELGGAQISGVMNVSVDHVRGAQITSVLNVAKTVGGAQVGLVNICDSIQGVPLGLFSYVHAGYHHIELATDETFPINVALYTGVRAFHNIFAAGIHPGPDQVWYYGYGFGTAPRLSKKLDLSIQFTALWLNEDAPPKFNLLNRFAIGLDYRFHKHFSLHAAGVLNGLLAPEAGEFPVRIVSDNLPILRESHHAHDLLLQIYPGARIALRYRW